MARIAFRNHFKIGSVAKCNKRHISWDFQPVSLAISSGNVGLITYGDDTLISGKKHDLKNESWKREPNAKPVTITQYGIYIYTPLVPITSQSTTSKPYPGWLSTAVLA